MEPEEPIDLVKNVYELNDENKRLQGVNKALLEAAKAMLFRLGYLRSSVQYELWEKAIKDAEKEAQ